MQTAEESYIDELVAKSRLALKECEKLTQRQVDVVAAAIVYSFSRPEVAQHFAEMTLEETKMGKLESKIAKLTDKMPAVLHDVLPVKTVGLVEEDAEKGIRKLAKPVGVIAALVPSTNPEATPLFKGVLGLRGRNTVIFAPHPSSRNTTFSVVEKMRDILEKNGLPKDIFLCIDQPSKLKSQLLMAKCDLTMATGSGDMVKAAYSSGKPAYGVGAGNAAVVVDETADLSDAAHKIMIGKTGDNASGCSAENALVIQEGVYNDMVKRLQQEGGYLASPQEKEKLRNTMWVDGHLNRAIVAKPVQTIAELAGINVPKDTNFIMVEEDGVGKAHPFSGEKISLVLTLFKYDTFQHAIDLVNEITRFSGFGHSCGIHSFDEQHIMDLALQTYTTRVIVRQPHGVGNSGSWFNGLPKTFSLGCGTWGGNIVSESITQKHYINTTWVAVPTGGKPATEEEIYGDLLQEAVL